MARPKKDGLEYFPHDTDAANDEKVETLRLLYKNDGYAFYFMLLERIYRTRKGELDISDPETIEVLANKIGISVKKFLKILDTSLKQNCFDKKKYKDKKILTSNGIKMRMKPVLSKRMKSKEFYGRVSATETPPETLQKPPQKPIHSVEFLGGFPLRESKVKESNIKDTVKPNPSGKSSTDPNLIDYFFRRVFEVKKFKPIIKGGRDGALIKAFLKSRSRSDGEALIEWFLGAQVSDKLGASIGHCFSANVINQWLGAMAKQGQNPKPDLLPHQRRV